MAGHGKQATPERSNKGGRHRSVVRRSQARALTPELGSDTAPWPLGAGRQKCSTPDLVILIAVSSRISPCVSVSPIDVQSDGQMTVR